MNRIRNIFLVSVFLTGAVPCFSQSFITIDGSQAFSNFKFTDSNGNTDANYSSIATGGYSIGYRAFKKGVFGRANVGMRRAGSSYEYDGKSITYNLQYCDIRLGVGYQYDAWRFKPYVSLSPYYSFLLKASQNLDGVNYDMKANDRLKNSDYGVLIVPGLSFFASDYISIYSEFSYLIGLQNIETTSNQTLKNKGFFISLGIAATLTKSKPKWLQGN